MRLYLSLLISVGLAGCATVRPSAPATSTPPAAKPLVREAAATRVVETRFDLRAYLDPDSAGVRHEAHAVYRRTRVPARVASLEIEPRSAFAPVSYAPLPMSTELAAELATQKQITAELRMIERRMVAMEQQAQGQYGALVGQTTETAKLRQQLEDERNRTRELEAERRDGANAAPAVPAPAAADPKL